MEWANIAAIPFLAVFLLLFREHSKHQADQQDKILTQMQSQFQDMLRIVVQNSEAMARFAEAIDRFADQMKRRENRRNGQ